jgi:hypothetical protein
MTASDVAAWVGAITGAAALLWQVTTWRQSAHRVTVERASSVLFAPFGEMSEPLLGVTVRNIGAAPVTVTNWGVSLGRKRGGMIVAVPMPMSATLPHRLEPGASMQVFAPMAAMTSQAAGQGVALRTLRVWAELGTGQTVRAKRGLPV